MATAATERIQMRAENIERSPCWSGGVAQIDGSQIDLPSTSLGWERTSVAQATQNTVQHMSIGIGYNTSTIDVSDTITYIYSITYTRTHNSLMGTVETGCGALFEDVRVLKTKPISNAHSHTHT